MIKLNSRVVDSLEVVVSAGSPLDLKCEGDAPVNLQTRLSKHKRYIKGSGNVRVLKVERPSAEFTGTYRCSYAAGSQLDNLTASVHLYVKGERLAFLSKEPRDTVCLFTLRCKYLF